MTSTVEPRGAAIKHTRRTLTIAAATLTMVISGCGSDRTVDPSASISGTIIVSGAASLTDAFTTIRDDFVADNPDAEVTLNFGSSGALATQIQQGAPADVVAFADTTPMTTLSDAGLLSGQPEIFATNQLAIVTKPGNPEGITGLGDLAAAGTISLCVDTAPCGKFANQILQAAGVTVPETSVTRGTDVTSTLSAVTEGDAIAGIVYVTDAAAVADQVDTIDIAESDNVVASYPIAVVGATASPEVARAFVDYVRSADGRAVLTGLGFGAP